MKTYLLIFLLIPVSALAQSDHDKEQQELYALLFCKNLKEVKAQIDNKFLKSKNKSRQVIGYVYLARYYKLADEKNSDEELLKALQQAKKIASETQKEIDEAYVEYGNTIYYRAISKWDLYIKSLEKSISIFRKNPNENFMIALLYQSKIHAINENTFKTRNIEDNLLINRFAKRSGNKILIASSYNDIGTFHMYNFEKNIDSIQNNYNKSLEIALQVQDPGAKKALQFMYYSNMGIMFVQFDQYKKGLEYSIKGWELYKNSSNAYYLFSSLHNIGYVYSVMGHDQTALQYYFKAKPFIGDQDITPEQRITFYDNITIAYENLHMYEKALIYERKTKEEALENDQRLYLRNTKSLEAFYQIEQEKNILTDRNRTYKKVEKWYIIAIVSTISGLIFLFFAFHYRQKLNTKTTSLLNSEKEKLKMERELAVMKQEQLQKQALATSIQLEHKNTFINELKENVQKNRNLNHLLKEEHLVDNSFNTIRNIIQETHPNFFKRLSELSGNNLTNTELKYAAYIHLNMDNMQIAAALKVEPKTVSVTKYRLKQKLKVDKNQDLNHFIRNLVM